MDHSLPLITTLVGGLVLAYLFGMLASRLRISPMVGVSIHRNSIDTGKMRRSSLDPTFLLA